MGCGQVLPCPTTWRQTAARICAALSITLAFASSAKAEILYNNGAIVPDGDAWTISGGYRISDSFTLSSESTFRAFDSIGLSVPTGYLPISVEWSIGTTAFGNDIAGPSTSGFSYTYISSGIPTYDAYSAAINVGSLTLAAGTYWLTLGNGIVSSTDIPFLSWIESGGPSQAHQQYASNPATTIPSQSFAVDTVPEPSTGALLGLAAAILIGSAGRVRVGAQDA